MMNALVLSPREIINPRMLNMLLTGDGSLEEKQLLAELGNVNEQQIQKKLDELIPSFSLAFDSKAPISFSSICPSSIEARNEERG